MGGVYWRRRGGGVPDRIVGKGSGAFPFEHGILSYSVCASFQKVEDRGV